MRNVLVLALMSCALSGCTVASAYWNKPTKYKALPDKSDGAGPDPEVATVSLDASRRLVISQRYAHAPRKGAAGILKATSSGDPPEGGSSRFTCAESPPDIANNTLAQSLIALQSKGEANFSAGSAYQVIAQAIHARTSTVETWRTTSSTYCLLLMNGMDDAAKNYLEVAKVALAATNDTTVTIPAAAASIDGLMAAVNNVAKKQEAASEAAAKKVADEKLVQGLAKAKEACDKIAEADRPDNVDCKKVAAGESAAKQGQGKPAPSG